MRNRFQQLGTLVVLIAWAASAWSQTARYTVPAASVEYDFSAYHQTLTNKADVALASLAHGAETSTPIADGGTNRAAHPDAAILQHFAQQYWNGDHENARRALERVTRLRPTLDPILRAEGVPHELVAVVIVESGGRPMALSPKGARGIWQFMPETARRYGLTVTGETDERLDVQKSTLAAAQYLRDLHVRFGDWSLALAAYNAGEKLVQNAVLRAGSKDFALLSRNRLLPAETRTYVPAVLAASNLLTGTNPLGSGGRQILGSAAVRYASSAAGSQ